MKKASKVNWQEAQSKIRLKKKIKLALVVLSIVILIITVGNSARFISSLFKPFNLNYEKKSYSWDGKFNLYLTIRSGEEVFLLVFNPTDKKVISLEIPPQTLINVPGGFGPWQVRSIYELGEKSSKAGSSLLKSSLSEAFGLPIDGYLEISKGASKDAILNFKKNPFYFLSETAKFKTELTLLELIRLYLFLQQVRSDKFLSYNLLNEGLLEVASLADGTPAYLPSSILDSFVSDNLSDTNIKNEQMTIAVFNGTSYPGLAQRISRMISNMGGNIIILDNSENKFQYSAVYGAESLTKKRLSQIFNSKYAILDQKPVSPAGLPASRAHINILLGEDMISP